jgi:hypothetical protein
LAGVGKTIDLLAEQIVHGKKVKKEQVVGWEDGKPLTMGQL